MTESQSTPASESHPLREGLPPLPHYLHGARVDERGYPVPFFVAWVQGKPDHRLVDPDKLRRCVQGNLCWVCGQPLGRFRTFVLGPMCAITRVSSEPPAHLVCATFAVQACPFLSRPQAHRRGANLPDEVVPPAGHFVRRNPGVTGLWTCHGYGLIQVPPSAEDDGTSPGMLFEVHEPDALEWFMHGRHAKRHEVEESIASGLPVLVERARAYPGGEAAAMKEIQDRMAYVSSLLDQSFALRGGVAHGGAGV